MKNKKRILTLHLKGYYWQQIKNGSKRYEYRLATPYWMKRIIGTGTGNRRALEFDEIHLLKGYPKRGDTSRLIRRKWRGCFITWKDVPLYDASKPVSVIAIRVN